jgi:sulfofructose kinase
MTLEKFNHLIHKPMNIIFLGGCTLDKVWMVHELPNDGIKIKAHKYFEMGGGMAANAAVAASRLGANTYFWARSGNDIIGKTIKQDLENYGINCQYFKLIDGCQSSVSAVIVDAQGERMIVNCSGSILSQTPAWLPLYKLNDVQAVQADTRWREGNKTLFEHARILNIPTILDIEKTDVDILNYILPYTDYAIFSESGFKKFVSDKYPHKNKTVFTPSCLQDIFKQIFKDYACKILAVTKGKSGVFWLECNADIIEHQAAFEVVVVDTTGAGDIFHGAFTYAIAKKYSVKQSMEFASAVAALKCTHMGGRSVPDLHTVEKFLQSKNTQ